MRGAEVCVLQTFALLERASADVFSARGQDQLSDCGVAETGIFQRLQALVEFDGCDLISAKRVLSNFNYRARERVCLARAPADDLAHVPARPRPADNGDWWFAWPQQNSVPRRGYRDSPVQLPVYLLSHLERLAPAAHADSVRARVGGAVSSAGSRRRGLAHAVWPLLAHRAQVFWSDTPVSAASECNTIVFRRQLYWSCPFTRMLLP